MAGRPRRGLLLGGAGLVAFTIATLTVLGGDWQRPDAAVVRVVRTGGAGRPAAWVAVAVLGDPQVLGVGVAVAATAVALVRRTLRPWAVSAGTLAVLTAAVESVKAVTDRAPPYAGPRSLTAGWLRASGLGLGGTSYPSGHAAGSVLAYGLVAALLVGPGGLRSGRRAGALAAVGAAVLGAVVGGATVFAGWHWPSDVVGGWLLGAAVLVGGRALLARQPAAHGERTGADPG